MAADGLVGRTVSPEHGFLVPDHYQSPVIDDRAMNIASIFWGFSLACAVFTGAKAWRQTQRAFKRKRGITLYIAMLWAEWGSNMCMAAMSWTFQWGILKPSFQFFFGIAFVWVFQVHCLLQIIINRIALLMVVPGQARKLKISVFVIMLIINISVFCIWIPARLQINPTYVQINSIWDPIEKVIFCLIDAALNIYFVYLVRTRLIDNGLTKYKPLFKVNCFLVGISLSLDVVLIGLMFSKNSYMYLQFHPVVYLSKMQIEMNMADLIVKVVRASNPDDYDYRSSTTGHDHNTASGRGVKSTRFTNHIGTGHNHKIRGHHTTAVEGGTRIDPDEMELEDRKLAGNDSGDHLDHRDGGKIAGIHKTVETTVVFEDPGETESRSSSTRELRRHYGVEGAPDGVEPRDTLADNK